MSPVLIGELAAATGTTTKTLRFYEHEGLLHPPARTAGGYRTYPPDARNRVAFIRRAQTAGLTLRQIREILDVRDAGRPPCTHVARHVDERLAEVEQRLTDLRATRRQLLALRIRLDALDPTDCRSDGFCDAIDGSR